MRATGLVTDIRLMVSEPPLPQPWPAKSPRSLFLSSIMQGLGKRGTNSSGRRYRLRELSDVMGKLFSTISERSWRSGEVPGDCRIPSATPICRKGKKDLGSYRPVRLTLVPGKNNGTNLLGACFWARGNNSEHGFSKWGKKEKKNQKKKSINLTAFCEESITSVHEGRAVTVAYLAFSKAVSQHAPTPSLYLRLDC